MPNVHTLTSEDRCEQSGDDTSSVDGEVEEREEPAQEVLLWGGNVAQFRLPLHVQIIQVARRNIERVKKL